MLFHQTNSTVTVIVIRQLDGLRPVTSMIIREVTGDETQRDQYVKERVKEHIREHCNKFIEFRKANWYVDIIGDDEITIIKSELMNIEELSDGYN